MNCLGKHLLRPDSNLHFVDRLTTIQTGRLLLYVVGEEDVTPSEALASNRAAIRQVVESHRARNARVFGSVLRGQDTDRSDLDILIDPTPETTLFDIGAIRHELGKLLGVSVDVLTPNALPDKFRGTVLAEARPI